MVVTLMSFSNYKLCSCLRYERWVLTFLFCILALMVIAFYYAFKAAAAVKKEIEDAPGLIAKLKKLAKQSGY